MRWLGWVGLGWVGDDYLTVFLDFACIVEYVNDLGQT